MAPTDHASTASPPANRELIAPVVLMAIQTACQADVTDDTELNRFSAETRTTIVNRLLWEFGLPMAEAWRELIRDDGGRACLVRTVRDLTDFSTAKVFSAPAFAPECTDPATIARTLTIIRDITRQLQIAVSAVQPDAALTDSLKPEDLRTLWTRLHWISRARFPPFPGETTLHVRRAELDFRLLVSGLALFLISAMCMLSGANPACGLPVAILGAMACLWWWMLTHSGSRTAASLPRAVRRWTFYDLAVGVVASSLQPTRPARQPVESDRPRSVAAVPVCPDCWHAPWAVCRICEGGFCAQHRGRSVNGDVCETCLEKRAGLRDAPHGERRTMSPAAVTERPSDKSAPHIGEITSGDRELVARQVCLFAGDVLHRDVTEASDLTSLEPGDGPLIVHRLLKEFALPLSNEWLDVFDRDPLESTLQRVDGALRPPVRTIADLVDFTAARVYSIPCPVSHADDQRSPFRMLEVVREVLDEMGLSQPAVHAYAQIAERLPLEDIRRMWTRLHWITRARFPPFRVFVPESERRRPGWPLLLIAALVLGSFCLGGVMQNACIIVPALVFSAMVSYFLLIRFVATPLWTVLPRAVQNWTFADLAHAISATLARPARRPHRHEWLEGRGWVAATCHCLDCWHEPVGACRYCEGSFCKRHGEHGPLGDICRACYDARRWLPLLWASALGLAALGLLVWLFSATNSDGWMTAKLSGAIAICLILSAYAFREALRPVRDDWIDRR